MEQTGSKNREKLNCKKLATFVAKDFAETTSIHGIKFIARNDISLPERCCLFMIEHGLLVCFNVVWSKLLNDRLLWAILFLVGFLFAILWSIMLWNNWGRNPVLTTVHSTNFPVKFFLLIYFLYTLYSIHMRICRADQYLSISIGCHLLSKQNIDQSPWSLDGEISRVSYLLIYMYLSLAALLIRLFEQFLLLIGWWRIF